MSFNFGVFAPTTSRAFIKEKPQRGGQGAGSGNAPGFLAQAGSALLGIPLAGTFEFDVVSVDVHKFENLITQNPLEDGSFVNDHITNQPYRVEIDFVISDTPISAINPLIGLTQSGRGRYKNLFADLEKIRDNNNPITVVTGLKVYKNMMFESLEATRDGQGHAVRGKASFVEARVFSETGSLGETFTSEDVEHSVGESNWFGLVSLAPLAL